uniref:Uncharacterized protein n=1 Tax=Glossina austeni TaxID=7395 RepID=A0A1A9VG99_GLOAU
MAVSAQTSKPENNGVVPITHPTSLFCAPEIVHRFVKNNVYVAVEFSDDDDLIDPEPLGSNKKTFASTLFYIPKYFFYKKELKFQDNLTSSESSAKHTDNPNNMLVFTLSPMLNRQASSNSHEYSCFLAAKPSSFTSSQSGRRKKTSLVSWLPNFRAVETVKAKPNKKVLTLSPMHSPVEIEKNDTRIPETIRFYNSTKFGVDVNGQMARKYSMAFTASNSSVYYVPASIVKLDICTPKRDIPSLSRQAVRLQIPLTPYIGFEVDRTFTCSSKMSSLLRFLASYIQF